MWHTNFLRACTFFALFAVSQVGSAKIPDSIVQHFAPLPVAAERVLIKAPDVAENGAVVPIGIEGVLVPGPDVWVEELWVFTHYGKAPVAHFKLGRHARAAGLSTRIRLAGTSVIYVVARLSDGSLVSGETLVKVTIGGCGNGGGAGGTAPDYAPPPLQTLRQAPVYWVDTERYDQRAPNGIQSVAEAPVSTFSVDVDTGSYSNVRRFLLGEGRLPPEDAVRVEEMINYFAYDYPAPAEREAPFSVTTELGPAPWNPHTQLLRIGLRAYQAPLESLPPANLVFLIDVSGSMAAPNKLDLLRASLKVLTRQLSVRDRIAIVVYAGASGVMLPPTGGEDTARILAALDGLSAGGSTNGGQGIQLAYAMARQAFLPGGINRVILATDGDFNVGTVNHAALVDLVKKQRASGVGLTTLGFGTGNYNDHLMEQLAAAGDGNYYYIDSLREARKVLAEQLSGMLYTVAKDVKVQVEFNPAAVAEYRLIGYENRLLRREDFANDRVDAGDIGAGHTVTALYEIAPVGSQGARLSPLRYAVAPAAQPGLADEVAHVRLRYQDPAGGRSSLLERVVTQRERAETLHAASADFRFAAAVAAFGQLLRGGTHTGDMDYARTGALARAALGEDRHGHRREFLELLEAAAALQTQPVGARSAVR